MKNPSGKMVLFSESVWKAVVCILGLLFLAQLLFSRHMLDVTVYTYRVLQTYYLHPQRSAQNASVEDSQKLQWSTYANTTQILKSLKRDENASPDFDGFLRPAVPQRETFFTTASTSIGVSLVTSSSGMSNTSTFTPSSTLSVFSTPSPSTRAETTSAGRSTNDSVGGADLDGFCKPELGTLFAPDENATDQVLRGGHWSPEPCTPSSSVAVIVPFRDRQSHLQAFLPHMHSFLQRQQLNYSIYILEQRDESRFNRAKLMNIGYTEASKMQTYSCYVFHDVDLLPLDERILYNCSRKGPLHMASAIDKFGFNMPYDGYFGGVSAFTPKQLLKINGFPNRFSGWGGEDDDIAARITYSGQQSQRYPIFVGKYRMFRHGSDKGNEANPDRFRLLDQTRFTWQTDGLNSLKYSVNTIVEYDLYTKISVAL